MLNKKNIVFEISNSYHKYYQNTNLISVTTTPIITLTTPEEPVAISSPNYPENYPNNVNIGFFILAPLDTHVELHFLDLELAPSCSNPLLTSGGKIAQYQKTNIIINLNRAYFEASKNYNMQIILFATNFGYSY